ncbi:23S ribosomal RNA methyltransferase Erm [Microbacterium immunditiarum]|uniref:23S rRNA (Adenine-N6)-dimethyltransferase n=1 Tax=Microbacterium immunditiarum TaxID=337480 RepID=A0A7Y9KHF2_9MICO|nr:23S ribosomal RNA methyltransferase Erm [Microbacterium immunditiarum]NYE19417.1 23S rRNA (adenine-N6)-dimethyltransferase [Microbacterium immunditiarum]
MRTHPRRSANGGRHELGQNFLIHRPTIRAIVDLVASTEGTILEIGAGDGDLTTPLARLGRPLVAIDIDEHRVRTLRRRLPDVRIQHADALRHPLDHPVVVGNVPYHLTTPIMRRMLTRRSWRHAILLTQWEVARKRAGVGGGSMMSAQAAPWFEFRLHGRVPARHFRPVPSVDGGIIGITRRGSPLVDPRDRAAYERFVRDMFTGRGNGLVALVQQRARVTRGQARAAVRGADIDGCSLPRDLRPEQWAALWRGVSG